MPHLLGPLHTIANTVITQLVPEPVLFPSHFQDPVFISVSSVWHIINLAHSRPVIVLNTRNFSRRQSEELGSQLSSWSNRGLSHARTPEPGRHKYDLATSVYIPFLFSTNPTSPFCLSPFLFHALRTSLFLSKLNRTELQSMLYSKDTKIQI